MRRIQLSVHPLSFAAGSVAAAMTMLLASPGVSGHGPADEVRTERLSIVNDSGRTVCSIYADPDGSGAMELRNEKGKPLVYAMADPISGHGRVSVSSKRGKILAWIGVDQNTQGRLLVANEKGEPVSAIGVGESGNGEITTSNASGVQIFHVGEVGNHGAVQVRDKEGKPAHLLTFSPHGTGEYHILKSNGMPSVSAVVTVKGDGRVFAWDGENARDTFGLLAPGRGDK